MADLVLNILPLAGVKEEVDTKIIELYPQGRRAEADKDLQQVVGE